MVITCTFDRFNRAYSSAYSLEFEMLEVRGANDYSERLFQASSDMVLDLLKDPKMTFGKKMIISLDLFQIASHLAENLSQFYHVYSQLWSGHKSEHLNYNKLIYDYMQVYQDRQRQIISGISETPYANWHQYLKIMMEFIIEHQTTYTDVVVTSDSFLASHIHLTNNRLGISSEFEFLLSEVSAVIEDRQLDQY